MRISKFLPNTTQVKEHPDYKKGPPLKHLNIGIEKPKPGDVAVTAVSIFLGFPIAKNISKGWGLTGYNQSPGSPLRSVRLTVTQVFSG